MIKCNNCGAEVGAADEKCRYCDSQTAYGIQAAQHRGIHEQQQQQWQDQVTFQRDQLEQNRVTMSVNNSSSHALWWAIGGFVVCCFPASIVGLVMSLRARKVAQKHSIIVPARGTVALALSVVGLLTTALAIGWSIVSDMQRDEARVVLEKKADKGARKKKLSHSTACAIVELELFDNGYAGSTGTSIDNFKCAGKLEQKGEIARIDRVRFKNVNAVHKKVACLRRGDRWDFQDFRELEEECQGKSRADKALEAAESAAAAASEAAPTPTPSPAPAPASGTPSAKASASAAGSARAAPR